MGPPKIGRIAQLVGVLAMAIVPLMAPATVSAQSYEPVKYPVGDGWLGASVNIQDRGQAYLITGGDATALCGWNYPNTVFGVVAHDKLPDEFVAMGHGDLAFNPVPFLPWDKNDIYGSLGRAIEKATEEKAAQLRKLRGHYVRAKSVILIVDEGGGTVCKENSDTGDQPLPPAVPAQTAIVAQQPSVIIQTAAPAAPAPAAPQTTILTSSCQSQPVWNDSTNYNGHGVSPVGGLYESRWIVGETWRASSTGGVLEAYVWVQPPNTVVWLNGHAGGSAWAVCANSEAEAINIARSNNVAGVTARDGRAPWFLVLPYNNGSFGLLSRYQTGPA